MKLSTLLLPALAAIAAAVPAPHPDGSLEFTLASTEPVPSDVITAALDKQNQLDFTWATEEYCGDDGSLRARGRWSVNGYHRDYEFGGSHAEFVWIDVAGIPLHISYDFDKYVTNFEYGGCKWGQLAAGCGMCHLNMWNGTKPDCSSGEKKKDTRSRTDECYLQVEGAVPPRPAVAQLETTGEGSKDLVDRHLAPESDTTITLPTTQAIDSDVSITADAGGVGYFGFGLSITEYCEASPGTPLKARGYWMVPGSSQGGQSIDFGDGRVAMSFDLGYSGMALLVGPYEYSNSVVGLHYGGCHWDQDVRGIGGCGFCKSSPWSSGDLNCAMNAAAGRTHYLECSVAVQWENANSPARPKIAARNDATIAVDSSKRNDNQTVEDLSVTRTIIPEVIATQTALDSSETSILAFHYTLTEYCDGNEMKAKGRYKNGDFVSDMDLFRGLINRFDHLVHPYPQMDIGPYKYDTNHLRFAYSNGAVNCDWTDDQTWKSCGECRAALWSSPSLNCAAGGSRTKEMDCSFVLGITNTKRV